MSTFPFSHTEHDKASPVERDFSTGHGYAVQFSSLGTFQLVGTSCYTTVTDCNVMIHIKYFRVSMFSWGRTVTVRSSSESVSHSVKTRNTVLFSNSIFPILYFCSPENVPKDELEVPINKYINIVPAFRTY